MRWLLLLVLVRVSCARYIFWRMWASSQTDKGVLKDTGYCYEQLGYIWDKYSPKIVPGLSQVDPFCTHPEPEQIIALCLYAALWYIHLYPSTATFGQRHWRFLGKISEKNFSMMVIPVLICFSNEMDEIYYNDRLHHENHGTGIFAKYITTFIDTAPIFVQQPDDIQLARLLFQPKYGSHVYKIQVAVNFLGWIVYYSGPHFGTEADNTIFEDTMYEHPMRSWEFWCGDGIYNSCYGVLTRYILQAGQVFTRMQVAVNAWIGHYRQRVEHVMHTIKAHNMWRMPFRGSYPMLQACLHLTIHMSAAKIKHAWADEAFHKYPGLHTGPWPRAP
jgi:hypothetical protein